MNPDGVILYQGSKNFWRQRINLDLNFVHHSTSDCYELIGYDDENGIESRIYTSASIVLSKLSNEEIDNLVNTKKEDLTRQKKPISMPQILEETTKQFVSKFFLSRVNLSENPNGKGFIMILNQSDGDTMVVNSDGKEQPDFLIQKPEKLVGRLIPRKELQNATRDFASVARELRRASISLSLSLSEANSAAKKLENQTGASRMTLLGSLAEMDFSSLQKKTTDLNHNNEEDDEDSDDEDSEVEPEPGGGEGGVEEVKESRNETDLKNSSTSPSSSSASPSLSSSHPSHKPGAGGTKEKKKKTSETNNNGGKEKTSPTTSTTKQKPVPSSSSSSSVPKKTTVKNTPTSSSSSSSVVSASPLAPLSPQAKVLAQARWRLAIRRVIRMVRKRAALRRLRETQGQGQGEGEGVEGQGVGRSNERDSVMDRVLAPLPLPLPLPASSSTVSASAPKKPVPVPGRPSLLIKNPPPPSSVLSPAPASSESTPPPRGTRRASSFNASSLRGGGGLPGSQTGTRTASTTTSTTTPSDPSVEGQQDKEKEKEKEQVPGSDSSPLPSKPKDAVPSKTLSSPRRAPSFRATNTNPNPSPSSSSSSPSSTSSSIPSVSTNNNNTNNNATSSSNTERRGSKSNTNNNTNNTPDPSTNTIPRKLSFPKSLPTQERRRSSVKKEDQLQLPAIV